MGLRARKTRSGLYRGRPQTVGHATPSGDGAARTEDNRTDFTTKDMARALPTTQVKRNPGHEESVSSVAYAPVGGTPFEKRRFPEPLPVDFIDTATGMRG